MTDKQQQPEALELASVAESADLAGYPTAKKANAYCLCLLEDCAQMIRRLHAELEALRMGYAAARLEIESLKAQLAERASHGQAPAETGNSVSARADSVQDDAARLDFLIEQRAYVVSDPDACPGYWLHWAMPDGRTWVQGDEHPTPRAAIDAARKQGARWQSAVRALTLHI